LERKARFPAFSGPEGLKTPEMRLKEEDANSYAFILKESGVLMTKG
jgi:hypothetical protein